MMMTLRWSAALLSMTLLLVSVGCRTATSPDPFGHGGRSPMARLMPQTPGSADKLATQRTSAVTGDPFLSSKRDVDVDQLGRAMVSDAGLEDMRARDASYLAGHPVGASGQQLVPAGARDPETAASEDAVNRLLQSQRSADALDESTVHRRLRQLELELQLTDDHEQQNQLALEIARLRKQLRSGRR